MFGGCCMGRCVGSPVPLRASSVPLHNPIANWHYLCHNCVFHRSSTQCHSSPYTQPEGFSSLPSTTIPHSQSGETQPSPSSPQRAKPVQHYPIGHLISLSFVEYTIPSEISRQSAICYPI